MWLHKQEHKKNKYKEHKQILQTKTIIEYIHNTIDINLYNK